MDKPFVPVFEDYREAVEHLNNVKPHGVILGVKYYLINKTDYMFHFYAKYSTPKGRKIYLVEFLYDLRNKDYFYKSNGQLLEFNQRNLDKVIPRLKDVSPYSGHFNKVTKDTIEKFFNMVSTENNKGMYIFMLESIGSIGEERVDMTSRALIRLIKRYNKLELLYKAGVYNTYHRGGAVPYSTALLRKVAEASEKKEVNKPHEVLGLNKQQFKFIRQYRKDDYLDYVTRAHYLEEKDMNLYRNIQKFIKDLEEEFGLEGKLNFYNRSIERFSDFLYNVEKVRSRRPERAGDLTGIIYHFDIKNVKRLVKYLLFECDVSQGMSMREAIRTYRDYYSMCKDMGYNNFTKYPRFLKTYHDVVARNYKLVEDEVKKEKFAEAVKEYDNLTGNIRGTEYTIEKPKNISDLVTEGNELQHCVASYCDRIINKNTNIVFLREKDKPKNPLVTVEVRDNKIVQAYGWTNRVLNTEEKEALSKYAKTKKLEMRV